MANDSKIVITFIKDPIDTNTVTFERDDGITTITNLETYQDDPRSFNELIQITTPTGTSGEAAAIAYETLFNLDHNAGGIYTISRLVNVVTITMSAAWQFQNFSSAGALATSVITLGVPQTYTLTSVTFVKSDPLPCEFVQLDIITSENTTIVDINGLETTITPATNFSLDVPRTTVLNIILKNAVGETIPLPGISSGGSYYYFNRIYWVNIDIIVDNSPNGATVTANVDFSEQLQGNPSDLILTYSLDDINYFSSNIFTGQVNGSYIMYVKDNYSCKVQKIFEVTSSGTRAPFFFISKANSITFSKNEVWDGYAINKNDENTLSCTALALNTFKDDVLLQRNDIITIQFKSNFDTNLAYLEKTGGLDNVLTVNKKSNNLNRFDRLDSRIYAYDSLTTGVYFMSGNRYNAAGGIIGTYELNGNLPDFAIIGGYIEISSALLNGIYQIIDIIYDATINRQVILFSAVYTGIDAAAQVWSTYNLLDFEVYEFTIDFSLFPIAPEDINTLLFDQSQEFRLRIEGQDAVLTNEKHYSENISIRDVQENTLLINYYNNNNRDIFYIYGIKHLIRVPYINITGLIEDDIDISINDLINSINESTLSDGNKFEFDAMARNIMLKTSIALSCENLFINDIGYIKKSSLDVKKEEGSNLYYITVELLKTNFNFNINAQGQVGVTFDYNVVDYRRLLDLGTGLIKT